MHTILLFAFPLLLKSYIISALPPFPVFHLITMFYYMFIGTPGIVIITGITVTFIFILCPHLQRNYHYRAPSSSQHSSFILCPHLHRHRRRFLPLRGAYPLSSSEQSGLLSILRTLPLWQTEVRYLFYPRSLLHHQAL